MKTRLATLFVLLALGCTTAQPGGNDGPQQGLDVRVINDLIPPTTVTIYLAPASGIERALGNAFSSRTTDFHWQGLAPKGLYQLVARTTSDRLMNSATVVLDGVLGIEWNLQSNLVTITRTIRDE